MQPRTQKTLAEIARKTWNTEIGFSGYDPVEKTVNGVRVHYNPKKAQVMDPATFDLSENVDHQKRREYRNSIPRQVASFFFGNFLGMRNDTEVKNIGRAMVKNMVWWPEEGAPTGQRVMQFIGMGIGFATLITPAYVLYSLVSNIVLNTARLALKFVPQLAVNGFGELQKRVAEELKNNPSDMAAFGWKTARVALAIAKAPFQAIQFVGGAILSPIENFRMAGKRGGFWLAALSVAVTAVAYAILFPIVAFVAAKQVPAFFTDVISPLFTNTIVPFLTAKTPWLVNAATAVGNFFAPAVTWVGNVVSGVYNAVSGWVSDALSAIWNSTPAGSNPYSDLNFIVHILTERAKDLLGFAISPKLVAFGAMLSAGLTVVATPFVLLYQFVANKFVNNTPAPAAGVAPAPVARPIPVDPALALLSASVRRLEGDRNQLGTRLAKQFQDIDDKFDEQARELGELKGKLKEVVDAATESDDNLNGLRESVGKQLKLHDSAIGGLQAAATRTQGGRGLVSSTPAFFQPPASSAPAPQASRLAIVDAEEKERPRSASVGSKT